MAEHGEVDRDTCTEAGCIGVRLPSGGGCWTHAADHDLEAALKQVGAGGNVDARGVSITTEVLNRILAAAPRDDHGHTVLANADFRQATFHGGAGFGGAIFGGQALFGGATFSGIADFRQDNFHGGADFDRVTFESHAEFEGTTFGGVARFFFATFQGDARFGGVTFEDYAEFEGTTITGDAGFNEATFKHIARFDHATFGGEAQFDHAVFGDHTGFVWVTFEGNAHFRYATLTRAWQLGPMLVRGTLYLNWATFFERIRVEVSAPVMSCVSARFLEGVQLRIRRAEIALDDADLATTSSLIGVKPFEWELSEDPLPPHAINLGGDPHEVGRALAAPERLAILTPADWPRLVSARRADVAGLTVTRVDLRACMFAGARHLDRLQLDETDFASAPRNWRWTARKAIAEEHHWRVTRHSDRHPQATAAARRAGGAGGWYRPTEQPPRWLHRERLDPEYVAPAQIAELYRSLRKGREDNKDEPGAADFYYGEMEMRRHDPTKPRAERFVLTLYWVVCGYALRASRALAWLLGLLAVAAVLLAAVGLQRHNTAADWSFPARLGTAALVAVEGAVFRAAEQELTYTGRLIQVALRIAGPVLLGLAALSIRGRVKR